MKLRGTNHSSRFATLHGQQRYCAESRQSGRMQALHVVRSRIFSTLGTFVAATAAFSFRSIHHVQCLNNAPKMVNEFIPVQTFTTTPSRRITP
jgi:hypothetical protein